MTSKRQKFAAVTFCQTCMWLAWAAGSRYPLLEQRVGRDGLQSPFWLQPLGDSVIPKAKEQVAISHVNWLL